MVVSLPMDRSIFPKQDSEQNPLCQQKGVSSKTINRIIKVSQRADAPSTLKLAIPVVVVRLAVFLLPTSRSESTSHRRPMPHRFLILASRWRVYTTTRSLNVAKSNSSVEATFVYGTITSSLTPTPTPLTPFTPFTHPPHCRIPTRICL